MLGVLLALPPLSLVDMFQDWRFRYLVRFTFPFFDWYASSNLWKLRYLVSPPLLGCFLAWTLVFAPYFFFSSFLLCFLFIKFDRVSSQWAFLDLYIYIFKCLSLWNIFYWWWWRRVIRRNRASWRVHWTCTGPLWGKLDALYIADATL
jgi:hypothetical protein